MKVSGRKGLGVKADDLMDALTAKARSEVDARDPSRDAGSREATAAAIATGALRYFLLKYGRTKVITFDMDEALAFTGETGPYVQNGVVRARNIFAKLEAEGHAVEALLERARQLDLDSLLSGEEGDGLVAPDADGLQRGVQQTVKSGGGAPAKHAFAVAQAFPRTTRSRGTLSSTPRATTCAPSRPGGGLFVRHMEVLTGLLDPRAGADVRRSSSA